MGTTSRGLPYPEPEEFVKDGATAIQGLADAVNDELDDLEAQAVIVLAGGAGAPGVDERAEWDTGDPLETRGAWTFPAGDHLIIPPAPGWYLVSASFTPVAAGGVGGGSGFNTYGIKFQTMVSGADIATATGGVSSKQSVADGETCRLHVSGLVRVNSTANRGIIVTIDPGSVPGVEADAGARLQIMRLGGL